MDYKNSWAYQTTLAAKDFRINPTFQAVVRSVNFEGLGIVPFFTPRHIVAADTPYNLIIMGSRIKPLFGD
jgi:hypothetical protein